MPSKKHILCISYDQPLLTTRKMILEREGYKVSTAYGLSEAKHICDSRPKFDLVLLGHTIWPHHTDYRQE